MNRGPFTVRIEAAWTPADSKRDRLSENFQSPARKITIRKSYVASVAEVGREIHTIFAGLEGNELDTDYRHSSVIQDLRHQKAAVLTAPPVAARAHEAQSRSAFGASVSAANGPSVAAKPCPDTLPQRIQDFRALSGPVVLKIIPQIDFDPIPPAI